MHETASLRLTEFPVITARQLMERINDPNLIILDGSWYLPGENRNARREFADRHIPGARFFDIDQISDPDSDLPHMLPTPHNFSKAVQKLGVSNDTQVVAYDGKGLFSAARVWWMFRIFGHKWVSVLNGGLPGWMEAGFPATGHMPEFSPGTFHADFDSGNVATVLDVRDNIETGNAAILDARSFARFSGTAPEPRPELPSGHMPGAISLPFTELLEHGGLKSPEHLRKIFDAHGIREDMPIITSCGSGVTAAVINLALFLCGFGMQRLYDGSWTEWASGKDNPVVHGSRDL